MKEESKIFRADYLKKTNAFTIREDQASFRRTTTINNVTEDKENDDEENLNNRV